MTKKRIAIVSKSDSTGGGASRIAAGLTKLLNSTEAFVAHHWVGTPGIFFDENYRKLHGGKLISPLVDLSAWVSRSLGFPDFFTPELLVHRISSQIPYDIYHIHDIPFTLSPMSVSRLSSRRPTAWTLHDCSPFTGGCLYPMGCERYRTICGHCPQLDAPTLNTRLDFTGWMQSYKKRVLNDHRLSLVSPSQWLIDEMKAVKGLSVKPARIVNFVDTQVFREFDKTDVRRVLGLPPDRFIILITATHLADQRKGMSQAISTLEALPTKPYVLAIGNTSHGIRECLAEFDHCITGYIFNDALLAQYYAAADVFLFTSVADNLPTVVLETMACGTPTLAFATGGVPEMISHDVNGWVVPPGDIASLARALQRVMDDNAILKRWRDEGRRIVNAEFNADRFLKAHLDLYNKLLAPA